MANIRQKKIINLPQEIRLEITEGLLKYGKVKVVGLGIFETRNIPSRPGRHPKTGVPIKISAYTKIKFRPTSTLKSAVC